MLTFDFASLLFYFSTRSNAMVTDIGSMAVGSIVDLLRIAIGGEKIRDYEKHGKSLNFFSSCTPSFLCRFSSQHTA